MFKPGLDYLTYDTPQEAAHIVRTASPEYLQHLANNLSMKIREKLGPKVFWRTVLGALEK